MLLKEEACVLVIEDQEEIQLSAKFLLRKLFSVIDVCNMPSVGLEKLNQRSYDVVLLDMNFSRGKTEGEEGLFWLKKLMQARPETVIVLMTAFGDVELAIKSIKNGAFDFILKPWNNSKFCETLSEALRYSQTRKKLHQRVIASEECIGSSLAWLDVMQKAARIARTEADFMITGESGSGKKALAEFIHKQSSRRDYPILFLDLNAIPASQMLDALYGDASGVLKKVKNGTLVLHEISRLSHDLQVKLFESIKHRTRTSGRPVGGLSLEARLMVTSNTSLSGLVSKGQFHKELSYALSTVEIALPPLRERGQDQVELATYFLKQFSEKYQRGDLLFSETAISAISKYRWPGNVRELRQAVERAVILASDRELEPDDLIVAEAGGGSESEEHLMSLEEVEMSMIKKALTKHGGVISHAANELGLTRASLYRRLEKYGL